MPEYKFRIIINDTHRQGHHHSLHFYGSRSHPKRAVILKFNNISFQTYREYLCLHKCTFQ